MNKSYVGILFVVPLNLHCYNFSTKNRKNTYVIYLRLKVEL